jgi:hypothetical protein
MAGAMIANACANLTSKAGVDRFIWSSCLNRLADYLVHAESATAAFT